MLGMFLSSCQDAPTSNNTEMINSQLLKSNVQANIASASNATSTGSALPTANNYPAGAPLMLQAGNRHHCAYFPEDGNVVCWGTELNWDSDPESDGKNTDDYMGGDAIGFDSGDYTNCVLLADGTTKCWGYKGKALSYDGGDAVQVATGYGQSCVLTESGEVNCYGGYLGGTSWQPLVISGSTMSNAEWVAASSYAVCVKQEGQESLSCKGWNVSEPTWDVEGTPTPNAGGHYAMCLVTEEGNVDCMNNGYNEVGQTAGYQGGDVVDVEAQFDQACFTTEAGDVKCFGRKNDVANNTLYTAASGVGAIAVSISGAYPEDDVCYADASGNITCVRDDVTPPEYNSSSSGPETTVYASGLTSVTTWDALPNGGVLYQNNPDPSQFLNAGWTNPHEAYVIETVHPWETEGSLGDFPADWINAWSNDYSDQSGVGSVNWTKYTTTISGEGDYFVRFMADNYSWVFLDGVQIGYQGGSTPGDIPVSLNGDHEFTFVILDTGGRAGGKFRLETEESYYENGGGGNENTPPVVDAGTDQTLDATGQTTPVNLDGSGSSDPDGDALTYSWTLNGQEVSTTASFSTSLADGSYTFTLTVSDGEATASDDVSVTVVNTTPTANAGQDITKEATGPTTSVTLNGSGSDADGDALTYSWSNGSANSSTTVELGLGVHTFTLTVSDGQGASDSDEVTVKITDTTAPEITYTQEKNNLWPPNHKMVLVASNILATDIVDGTVAVEVNVASNEPSNGKGDGNTSSDYEVHTNPDGSLDVYVRAERSGKGKGRTYTVTMTSTDETGNSLSESFDVSVAKNQGNDRSR